ncbi:putative baseplate assembly protein [Crenobacter sp. SG2303]|uniref:Baseplate assembly protein n=1 Tax=Crenobacter oryzisoli TaxID=3056844 RepID=A0ABT7XN21_9NEIS|nr:putative baseplate assembly protein [Crenobacter sp. SG2303]MDN0075083.1 putative baseplate assembly protein [Crenobacter sp. SG2303]MDN0076309.1 putative baseplate assembly protein [Crenobacter sp. SG2303]
MTRYTCCDELRRNAVDEHPTLNGIDYLEVLDGDAPAGSPRQRTLLLRCLKPAPALTLDNVRLTGGERVRDVHIEWIAVAASPPVAPFTTAAEQTFFKGLPSADHVLLVRTDSNGDYSPYQLGLQRSKTDTRAPSGFDPRLAGVTFSFKVECPSDFDCRPCHTCMESAIPVPDINYLAKDYASFRRLMLDRMTQLLPAWRAGTPADLGVTLVELLAYAGDQLSYWQDAVATEAYLETARRRTSLRRHALLVDYALHEGSNARTWVQLVLEEGVPNATVQLTGLSFLSRVPRLPARIAADPLSRDNRDAFAAQPTVFEPLHPQGELQLDASTTVTLYATHHEMHFYTWGDRRCCLPKGAMSATLRGHLDTLQVGDVLIFEEVKGPFTGVASDADPAHRHAVRLTAIRLMDDANPLVDPLNDAPITEIEWASADALPFALCISARTDDEHGARFIDDVSVVRGNIILADHGLTVLGESLGAVPGARLRFPVVQSADHCLPPTAEPLPVRYRPGLAKYPLTHAATIQKFLVVPGRRMRIRQVFDPNAPATQAFKWDNADVLPVVRLTSTSEFGGKPVQESWGAQRDLLNSTEEDLHFVVESEHDGSASLRFGDGQHGRRPESGMSFVVDYRIGQGVAGNIGADALAHVVTDDVRLAAVRNPLPARGGSEAEGAERIRRRAPQAFRIQERAVTPDDYAAVTERFDDVQRAAATQRWTGSWHTLFITIDREGGEAMDDHYRAELDDFVEPYRMAGHDVAFNDPIYVPLELEMTVCVTSDHFRSDVQEALLQVLGKRDLPDGRRGLFHPDELTFGQAVYLSTIYAAARSVPGVETVEITRFGRQGQTDDLRALHEGVMRLGRLEIARLDNDVNFPERGVLRLHLHGGK